MVEGRSIVALLGVMPGAAGYVDGGVDGDLSFSARGEVPNRHAWQSAQGLAGRR
jgi:hypothetical protein